MAGSLCLCSSSAEVFNSSQRRSRAAGTVRLVRLVFLAAGTDVSAPCAPLTNCGSAQCTEATSKRPRTWALTQERGDERRCYLLEKQQQQVYLQERAEDNGQTLQMGIESYFHFATYSPYDGTENL